MRIVTCGMMAGALALGLFSGAVAAYAQGPLYDQVSVNLPYTITLGDKTLQPGDYYIRELPNPGKSNVLLIYSDDGMKFETAVLTIPTVDPATPEETKVVLHHIGDDYYFDKIWIQGKNYGYEFPLPNDVKQREQEAIEPVTVSAMSQPAPAPPAAQPAQETQPPLPAPVREVQPAPEPQPAPQPMTAQNPPPPSNEANREENMARDTPSSPPPSNEADREEDAMPKTSAGWLMMLLGGGTLSGLGWMLGRKS
jgi:hypothetical protein